MFAEVVFPLPFRNAFSYSVPPEFKELISVGKRVAAPFGKRVLTGFVIALRESVDVKETIKDIHDVLDKDPIFDLKDLEFYRWIAEYYLSSLGEALKLSVPQGVEVETKRKVIADADFLQKASRNREQKKYYENKNS